MTDEVQRYLQGKRPALAPAGREWIREALEELLRLTEDAVAPAVTQVETQYEAGIKRAQTKYEQALEEIEAEYRARRREYEEQHKQRMDTFAAAYQQDIEEQDSRYGFNRDKVSSEAEGLLHKAKQQVEYELLTADTIKDGAERKYRQQRLETQEGIEKTKRYLEELRGQAAALMVQYRQTLPTADTETVEPAEAIADAKETFRQKLQEGRDILARLSGLKTAGLFAGARPAIMTILICVGTAGFAWALGQIKGMTPGSLLALSGATLAATLMALSAAAIVLWKKALRQTRQLYQDFNRAMAAVERSLELRRQKAVEEVEQNKHDTLMKAAAEEAKAKQVYQEHCQDIQKQRDTLLAGLETEYRRQRDETVVNGDRQRRQWEQEQTERLREWQKRYDAKRHEIQENWDRENGEARRIYEENYARLRERWGEGLACIAAALQKADNLARPLRVLWDDRAWQDWQPSKSFSPMVRFGSWRSGDIRAAAKVREQAPASLPLEREIVLPALLEFPNRCSLFVQSPRDGREPAIENLRSVMTHLFTSLPAGRVRFTIVDPVGLGENFAGFMHAGDYEESLVGGRIWTSTAHIQQQLENLTDHMENVIQKYLRNEYETIEDYNAQAGELAEPYRFLVIADFPINFSEESIKRLGSIVASGARCGVYTLIAYDERQDLPKGIDLADLTAGSVCLKYTNGEFRRQDEVLQRYPLDLDGSPPETLLTELMHKVGKAGKDSTRVEVPFETIAPPAKRYWSLDNSTELSVPIGKTGASRLQYLRLGRGVAQHLLIAGKTGSGKSTLLHVMITNLALWYAPEQLELYLIDFKKGVEFKTYVTHKLAHARSVAVESDREFGLSILQRLNAEMTQRGNLFRQAQVQDLAGYRTAVKKPLPRIVLMVDEFQVFFSEDDKVGQEAALLLEQLVRQGRAFGMHVILGSQTLGGSSSLARSTLGQMAVRIALQCTEADSQLIFEDDNTAARLLSRPGEAIYNDAGGMVAGNSPFQTAWLSDTVRDHYLAQVRDMVRQRGAAPEAMIVFEGNAAASLANNPHLARLLDGEKLPAQLPPRCWLGEPVAIKDATAAVFRRQSGAHLLIIGQNESTALALMQAALISLAAQQEAGTARFLILDGSAPEAAATGRLASWAKMLPHETQVAEHREAAELLNDVVEEMQRRIEQDSRAAPSIYLLIYGMQRYRALRRREDDFSFSADKDQAPKPDQQFAELLREGPPVGIHVIAWADTLATVERILDRQTLREFDNRVLFQMSALDSSNLIDSPAANQLGFYRALFFSEDAGILEKFRPYGLADDNWLAQTAVRLQPGTGGT